eukprot:3346473-Prymnesium_polylepis.1
MSETASAVDEKRSVCARAPDPPTPMAFGGAQATKSATVLREGSGESRQECVRPLGVRQASRELPLRACVWRRVRCGGGVWRPGALSVRIDHPSLTLCVLVTCAQTAMQLHHPVVQSRCVVAVSESGGRMRSARRRARGAGRTTGRAHSTPRAL